MAAGGGMVYWKNWIRLRDAKKHTIKAFWWFKGDLISQWIPKFYLCDESNPINPQCGKISANFYISPHHPPTHNFTHKNGGNWYTLPGWPKKLHLNRPARCAGQSPHHTTPIRLLYRLMVKLVIQTLIYMEKCTLILISIFDLLVCVLRASGL